MHTRTTGGRVFDLFNHLFLLLFGLSVAYPFIYVFMLSISGQADAMSLSFALAPREPTLTSYLIVLGSPRIWRSLLNSAFRAITGTVLGVAATALAAYPLSKAYLPGKRFFTFMIFFTMLFGGGLIPNYLLIKSLGLIDSRWALILPGLIGAFNVIIMRNFFQTIPEEIQEAARMDGAGEATILLRIILPLSMPIIATIGLWLAVGHWNAWFDAMIYINSADKQVLAVTLRRIVLQRWLSDLSGGIVMQQAAQESTLLNYTPESVRAATIMVAIVPILVVYPFLQRYFVKGVIIGSIKG